MALIQPAHAPLKRLFQYSMRYKSSLYWSVSHSFFNKLLDLAPPVLVGWAVDTVNRQAPGFIHWLSAGDIWYSAALLGILGFLIFGLESFFQWLYTLGFARIAQNVQHDLRGQSYRHMQEREMAFFEGHRLGETMAILNDDINQLERFLNTVFNDIVQIVSLFFIAGFILFSASPGLSVIAMLPMPLIIWGALHFQRLILPRYQAVRQSVGALNTRLENNISGIAVIKAFTAENFEASRLTATSDQYRRKNLQAIELSALFTPLIRMGVAIGFAAVLWVGGIWTLEGTITVGTFTLFAMMCQRILWPLTRLGQLLDETQRCRASAARVFGMLDTPSCIRDGEVQLPKIAVEDTEISFENVHLRYGEGPWVLRGVNFTIHAGETLGIAGATGAGKSSLVKLILRFYDPTDGCIRFAGHDLRDLNLASLRSNIALVSQDVYLFHGSIAENIAYGADSVPFAAIQQAARQAQLDEFIQTLPQAYDTIIGERGIKLSGGQRQRLSIARALLKNARVLILDEATSAVDTETERDIQRHLDQYTAGRTAIIIAHRLSTIRRADRILVFQNGQLVEQGNHLSLIENHGVYADLWSLQAGEL